MKFSGRIRHEKYYSSGHFFGHGYGTRYFLVIVWICDSIRAQSWIVLREITNLNALYLLYCIGVILDDANKIIHFLLHEHQPNRTFELRRFSLIPLASGSTGIGGTVPDTGTLAHAMWEDSTNQRPELRQLCGRENRTKINGTATSKGSRLMVPHLYRVGPLASMTMSIKHWQ